MILHCKAGKVARVALRAFKNYETLRDSATKSCAGQIFRIADGIEVAHTSRQT
jgi:hypothetical protein